MTKRMWLPAEIDDKTHQRMENWGQWIRRPISGGPSTSRGIEGKYRADLDPADLEPYAHRSCWAPVVDPHDASIVQAVLMHPLFPSLERNFLVGHYATQLKPERLASRIGIRWREYRRFQARALIILRNRLTSIESRRTIQSTICQPPESRGATERAGNKPLSARPDEIDQGQPTALAA
jgi:hypothetical protein